MRQFFVITAFLLFALSEQAQEKVMTILQTDGTSTQTRVAEIQEISFLSVENDNQGLLVKTVGGETVGIFFEANPIVTFAQDKLIVKSNGTDDLEFEISDIVEILFGDASEGAAIREMKGFAFVLQNDGAVLMNIPADAVPALYSIDGSSLPLPPLCNGELQLCRKTLEPGIYVVKVGTFSAKIKL